MQTYAAGAVLCVHPTEVDFEFLPPPNSQEEERKLTSLIDAYVASYVTARLSAHDRKALGPAAPEDVCQRFHRVLDQAILEITPEIGWQVFYSNMFRAQIAAWTQGGEAEGLQLLRKFSKALERYAHAQHGAPLPVTAEHRKFKDVATDELRTLQRLLRVHAQGAGRGPDLLENVRLHVHGDEDKFPLLRKNWRTFEKLASRKEANCPWTLIERFASADLGPSPFADRWIAAVLNRSPESARQDLTRIQPAALRRRKK